MGKRSIEQDKIDKVVQNIKQFAPVRPNDDLIEYIRTMHGKSYPEIKIQIRSDCKKENLSSGDAKKMEIVICACARSSSSPSSVSSQSNFLGDIRNPFAVSAVDPVTIGVISIVAMVLVNFVSRLVQYLTMNLPCQYEYADHYHQYVMYLEYDGHRLDKEILINVMGANTSVPHTLDGVAPRYTSYFDHTVTYAQWKNGDFPASTMWGYHDVYLRVGVDLCGVTWTNWVRLRVVDPEMKCILIIKITTDGDDEPIRSHPMMDIIDLIHITDNGDEMKYSVSELQIAHADSYYDKAGYLDGK